MNNIPAFIRQRSFLPPAVLLLFSLLLGPGWLATAPAAHAATLTVTNANDSGAGSLRAAVSNAAPNDTIEFDPSLTGSTITLSSGEILIDKNLTITGLGAADLTISGGGSSRVFQIGSGVTATISGLTISDGAARRGGGVYNAGTLTLTDCALTNNTATTGSGSVNGGGVINAAGGGGKATLTIERCTIINNESQGEGGGIGNVTYQDGNPASFRDPIAKLTVRDSTIAHNSAGYGGGVAVYAQFGGVAEATFINTTMSGNSATTDGGGFDVDILADGMSSRLTLINTTVYSNTAGGAGGGISILTAGSTLVSRNSIVAGNTADSGGDDINQSSEDVDIVFYGGNVIGSDAGIGLYSAGPGDQIGASGSPIDPLLGPLSDNGGPTQTHLPQPSSPAIDAALDSTCPTSDQRDENRPADGDQDSTAVCDSGAVEVQDNDLTAVAHCNLKQGETVHFGATGASAYIATLGGLNCLEVSLIPQNHPQATSDSDGPALETGRYWMITETATAADWSVDLSLFHENVLNPQACKYPGNLGGAGWDCNSNSATSRYVVRQGVASFSDWAVGSDVGPTAVLLKRFSTAMQREVNLPLGWLLAAGMIGLTVWGIRRRVRKE